MRAFFGGMATLSAGVLVLWLLLAGIAPSEIAVGVAVAIAVGAWARLADL